MRFLLCVLLWIASCNLTAVAQDENQADSAIVTNSVWDNWYVQFGTDMNLLFPHDHNVKDVFPNGKSFGVNAAVGKWFSPEFGGRFKLTWNNGILPNNHNTWLAPYGEAGQNHREGGFVTFIGDVLLNLHNLFGKYQPDRKWNISVGPRAGGYLNIGNGHISGAHILGVGVINTYRLSDRWQLFADLGYHFISSINGVSSGKGHGSNGYAELSVGVEVSMSKNTFDKAANIIEHNSHSVKINSIWDNWFVQAGLGMALMNPYGTNIGNVFPNGSSMGINFSIGKWFAPEAGVRGGLNWQNGIFGNNHAYYLGSEENLGNNHSKGGYVALYGDMLFDLHNIIRGYNEYRIWNAIIYPRMGVCRNFASSYSESPLVGLGIEHTFKVSEQMKIYSDVAYQVVTGGFLDGRFSTGADASSNGWFDINVGVQYELGQVVGWNKPGSMEARNYGYTDGHNWPRFIVNTGASVVVAYGAKTALKAMVKEERPDHSDDKSFPSGHASMAFAAARSIDKEFRKDNIWIPIAGYAAATAVGIERVASDRHHWYDVAAGAALGFGAAELTWWASDKLFGKGGNVAVGASGNTVDVVYNF
jgi:hypothetical protein